MRASSGDRDDAADEVVVLASGAEGAVVELGTAPPALLLAALCRSASAVVLSLPLLLLVVVAEPSARATADVEKLCHREPVLLLLLVLLVVAAKPPQFRPNAVAPLLEVLPVPLLPLQPSSRLRETCCSTAPLARNCCCNIV